MQIRKATQADIDQIRYHSTKPYDKLEPPTQHEESLAGVDDQGKVRIVITAEKVAELYLIMDHDWETPAMRWSAVEQLHREMLVRLREKGYSRGYSFFPDGVANSYIRRLVLLGWDRVIDRCARFVAG